MKRTILICISVLFSSTFLSAQTSGGLSKRDPDAWKPIEMVEKELAPLAKQILHGENDTEKFRANNEFARRFVQLLKRPESFDYPFDSLKTISMLKPKDNTFRIYTWLIVEVESDTSRSLYDKHHSHSYFGLVQRKFKRQDGKYEMIVTGLRESAQVPRTYESMISDQNNWFGALYYKPKHQDEILSYDGHYYKLVPKSKKEIKSDNRKAKPGQTITFIPGKFKKRKLTETEKPLIKTHKWVKRKVRYYVLTGWNGWGTKSNYKVIECMYFDPEDSTHVIFGAPVFYFESIPKSRVMFKYSENAPFSLNTGVVRRGLFRMRKEQMLVFDHIAKPEYNKSNEMFWELGPDGSTDALWFQKRLGVFMWLRDVKVEAEGSENLSQKQLQKQLRKRQKQMKRRGREDVNKRPMFTD